MFFKTKNDVISWAPLKGNSTVSNMATSATCGIEEEEKLSIGQIITDRKSHCSRENFHEKLDDSKMTGVTPLLHNPAKCSIMADASFCDLRSRFFSDFLFFIWPCSLS